MADVVGEMHRMASNDVLVVPFWHTLTLRASGQDAILFSYSDRPMQRALRCGEKRQ